MFRKLGFGIILLVLAIVAKGQQNCSSSGTYYTPSQNQYLFSYFNTLLNPINSWDGPTSVTGQSITTPTTTMTKEELNYYMYFAGSVYCPTTLQTLTCCYCSHFNSSVSNYSIITNAQYSTLALITVHPSKNEVVVTFRGSVALMNFVADAFLLPTNNPGIRIHRGFYLCLMSVYNQVVAELGPILQANPTYRVVSTGHSLGGAMSSLFVFFMSSLNQFPGTNFVLASFGQPRTGNQAYADYMNALTIPMGRVVARADIAPHVIPVSLFGVLATVFGMNYVHHTQEVWINGPTTKFCSKTKYEDPTCSNIMGPTYTLMDHTQYFDVDITSCYFVEGWGDINLLTLPTGFTPTNYLPPMPSKIYNFWQPIEAEGYQGLLPLL